MILHRFNQLIQIFFAISKNFLEASIIHYFCKCIIIFYNSNSVNYVKFQVLLFYAKLLFSIEQAINIFIKSVL